VLAPSVAANQEKLLCLAEKLETVEESVVQRCWNNN
jgi:hypothetical protein